MKLATTNRRARQIRTKNGVIIPLDHKDEGDNRQEEEKSEHTTLIVPALWSGCPVLRPGRPGKDYPPRLLLLGFKACNQRYFSAGERIPRLFILAESETLRKPPSFCETCLDWLSDGPQIRAVPEGHGLTNRDGTQTRHPCVVNLYRVDGQNKKNTPTPRKEEHNCLPSMNSFLFIAKETTGFNTNGLFRVHHGNACGDGGWGAGPPKLVLGGSGGSYVLKRGVAWIRTRSVINHRATPTHLKICHKTEH